MKCTALSRIVYGGSHWQFAACHIQLGKSYFDLEGTIIVMSSAKFLGQFVLVQSRKLNHNLCIWAPHLCIVSRAYDDIILFHDGGNNDLP